MFVVATLNGPLPTWGGEVREGGGELSYWTTTRGKERDYPEVFYGVIRCGENIDSGGGGV